MRSIAEQQNTIIKGVLGTNNPDVLTEVENFLLSETPCPVIPADTPENLKKAAYRALEQWKSGEYKTHEQAIAMFPFL